VHLISCIAGWLPAGAWLLMLVAGAGNWVGVPSAISLRRHLALLQRRRRRRQ